MNIHILETTNNFIKVQENVWESGYWKLDEAQAKKLVGGEIYFHKKRQEPSFYGGTILAYRVAPEGVHEGRIIFTLKHLTACRNVRTDKSGWSKNMKVIDPES
ncbi:MAG: hypothetical protein M0P04_08235 [Syntrophales bacterium]|jgi:hypothetical protein|nr:hypothetical protein [Syntrophales bacterium]MDD4338941.1 hypothetical protein [Syntrophales bacterium]HOG08170.1 hypothetical protein [Syntrophales bacterium]HOS77110.1 hypothetical protein [Syntrophales bacterium]HPB69537.1 hypothetical protein [Syntrophales bacterium]